MVTYNYLIKTIALYINKHHDYPKNNALQYYEENKRKFKKETWDEGVDHSDKDKSPPGHLFQQQNELQKETYYDYMELRMLEGYATKDFRALAYYHYGRLDDLAEELEWYNSVTPEIPKWEHDSDITLMQWGELYNQARTSFCNDPNPDNWFYDSGISDLTMQDCRKIGESLVHSENMTASDWKKVYEDYGVSSNFTMKDWSDTLSGMIEGSPRIQTDTVAWRYGELPLTNEGTIPDVGESGTFKSFTGLTYNEQLIKKGGFLYGAIGDRWGSKDNRYRIKVMVPHGTQGIVLGDSVGCDSWQNELLLNKNQNFVVVERNDKNHTATILLY